MSTRVVTRRRFLTTAGAAAAALLGSSLELPGQHSLIRNAAASGLHREWAVPRVHSPGQMGEFMPDAEIAVTAKEKWVQILPGAQTRVWSYEGQLMSGSGVTVSPVPGSYLGPVLRMQRGTKLRMLFHNNLAEDSVIHPHGLRVPEQCDGTPMQAIGPGQTKLYEFEVIDRAGPYWFHPHPHMRTAEQVLMGQAGLFYVSDPAEQAAVPGAATGANDVPVVIQDRTFDANNQFVYQPNNMWGYLGDRILVNGKVDASVSLEPRGYRLRLLNGSNARTYKLAWSNGMALKVIGTDGGLLPAAVSRSYVMLMPGERVDLWVDFSKLGGKQVILRSLSFDAGMGGMGGGGMGGGGMGGGGMGGGGMGGGGMGINLPMGSAFNVLTVNVARKAASRAGSRAAPAPRSALQRLDRSQLLCPPPVHAGLPADGVDDQRPRLRDDGRRRR